jgi:hypothetical protein
MAGLTYRLSTVYARVKLGKICQSTYAVRKVETGNGKVADINDAACRLLVNFISYSIVGLDLIAAVR